MKKQSRSTSLRVAALFVTRGQNMSALHLTPALFRAIRD